MKINVINIVYILNGKMFEKPNLFFVKIFSNSGDVLNINRNFKVLGKPKYVSEKKHQRHLRIYCFFHFREFYLFQI